MTTYALTQAARMEWIKLRSRALLGPGGLAQRVHDLEHVLALMAEGRSNAGIAGALVVAGGTVEKHVASIFDKLRLPPGDADNRRVLAVLRYLSS
jgi:DNA-binding NarL/FixJ family response regulator